MIVTSITLSPYFVNIVPCQQLECWYVYGSPLACQVAVVCQDISSQLQPAPKYYQGDLTGTFPQLLNLPEQDSSLCVVGLPCYLVEVSDLWVRQVVLELSSAITGYFACGAIWLNYTGLVLLGLLYWW